MSSEHAHLEIEYYSDVLCVWALIAEMKNAELIERFSERVSLSSHYLDLFCDTATRIGEGWKDKGGYEAFGDHVREVAARYLERPIDTRVWNDVRPTTSANAHLFIKATELALGVQAGERAAHALRAAFFFEGRDIGRSSVICEIVEEHEIQRAALEPEIETGRALAALLADSRRAQQARVTGSPTWRLNEGRQLLHGNVGYRVLSANIEELLRHPEHEASWC